MLNCSFWFRHYERSRRSRIKPETAVSRLETLISEINDAVLEKMKENREIESEEAEQTAKSSVLPRKYRDLSIRPPGLYFRHGTVLLLLKETQDRIFYMIVRIKSILSKLERNLRAAWSLPGTVREELMMKLVLFSHMIESHRRDRTA